MQGLGQAAEVLYKHISSAVYRRRKTEIVFAGKCGSLTIAIILYKYMHIYLWTALRIVVFERGLYGF